MNPSPLALRQKVAEILHAYFDLFSAEEQKSLSNLHALVIREVEAALLEVTSHHTQHNQCQMARILGLSRGTLRKRLQDCQSPHDG